MPKKIAIFLHISKKSTTFATQRSRKIIATKDEIFDVELYKAVEAYVK